MIFFNKNLTLLKLLTLKINPIIILNINKNNNIFISIIKNKTTELEKATEKN